MARIDGPMILTGTVADRELKEVSTLEREEGRRKPMVVCRCEPLSQFATSGMPFPPTSSSLAEE